MTAGNVMDAAEIKQMVRDRYGSIAAATITTASCCAPAPAASCCAPAPTASCGEPVQTTASCCEPAPTASCCAPHADPDAQSSRLGYSAAELQAVPEGANLGLGCGNPQAIAALRPGETLIDLGSGGGFDCLLAAQRVGADGRVIGVDMTHEMLAKARANAQRAGAANVEFRLGELEHLPVADNTADVIISNCVINLVPDKQQVFREAFRVLKPGGRLAIADVVNLVPLPAELAADKALLCGCVSGAAAAQDIEAWLTAAGFVAISIAVQPESRAYIAEWAAGSGIENYVASATIEARKL